MNPHSPGRPLFEHVEQLDNAPMEGRNGELYAFSASHSRSRSFTQPKKDTTEDPQLWLGLLRRIPTSNIFPAGPLPESSSLFLTFCGRARRISSLFEEQPRCAEVDDPFVDFAIASDGATRFSVLGDPREVNLPDGRSVFSRSSRVVCRGLFAIVSFRSCHRDRDLFCSRSLRSHWGLRRRATVHPRCMRDQLSFHAPPPLLHSNPIRPPLRCGL